MIVVVVVVDDDVDVDVDDEDVVVDAADVVDVVDVVDVIVCCTNLELSWAIVGLCCAILELC